uniref:histidine kinase n=1 Tax=Roseihalotalea indica TaxID=2867963 RepID=A0AA49GTF1_9BACT|nr:HAMP domain-containing sensor histidine kinase [Tunicatimonas sp. TK19036]
MSQDPKLLIHDVKQYLDQGSHDIKNIFHYLSLWFNSTEREGERTKAWDILQGLKDTYLTRIEELNKGFDEYLSITHKTSPAKINSLAELVNRLLAEYIATTQIHFQLERQIDEAVQITYPASFIKSTLNSLLDNALMYRRQTCELTVKIALYRKAEYVVLQCRDNGTGIDLERHGHMLFRPFQRFTDIGEGKGLSLHLVKTMVEKNGGSIELSSIPNEETTVTVYLKDYTSKKNARPC